MELSVIGYNSTEAWIRTAETVEELLSYQNPSGLSWINIDGLKNKEAIQQITEHFGIHPLTVEDILDTEQRPKVEEFDTYLFFTFKAINPRVQMEQTAPPFPVFEQISIILMENTVITFQEIPGDSFDGIRKRILNNGGRIRKMRACYLIWALLDSVVDEYFICLDNVSNELEKFEERYTNDKDTQFIPDLQKIKQYLNRIRRIIWPLRESLNILMHLDTPFIDSSLEPFLKDVHDNALQATETVDSCRELVSGMMEVNLSVVSARMNNVMKVLTIISTIFIPLTFIAGVYGMNFAHMPELTSPYGYPITWAVMIIVAIGMLIFFKRRHWI
ncbi:MAG: magnesium/cobalt transporter CorA [Treponema sp.]|jgi:magnesium transporter|nr:magnesium/cobalt transporter CorA [Treponema sp.]